MKLRNKKTGEIKDFGNLQVYTEAENTDESQLLGNFDSFEQILEYYEDYIPTNPLIEDEKARKVFQEWDKLYGAERFRATHYFNSRGCTTLLRSTDLTTEPSIELPGHIGKDTEIYTRVELCGEEKPRPVIVNDVKYSSYEDYLKSRGKK